MTPEQQKVFKKWVNDYSIKRTYPDDPITNIISACADTANYILSNPSLFGGAWVKGHYDKLYERAQSGKRTACYVDYDMFRNGDPCRDICTIKPGLLEPTARGISYGGMMDDDRPEIDRFMEMCEGLNLEWMPESATSDKDKEIQELRQQLNEKDFIIHGITEGSENWEQEYNDCRRRLQELVDLKELKDTQGKTEDYLKRQPEAWQAAKEFLSKYTHINF